jgi:DNA-binding MarR family transcriptional regulator
MFSEPAWEMLLNLYAAEGAGRLTVSGLALQSGSSKATALRWIDYLEHERLIEREAHPTDQRVAFVKLTEEGKEALGGYLSDVTELTG